jgi:hypothetical protein
MDVESKEVNEEGKEMRKGEVTGDVAVDGVET